MSFHHLFVEMAENSGKSGFSFDEEDEEWMGSKVTGFKFEDDDETPFQDLAKYQSQTLAANSIGGKEDNELVISFDTGPAGINNSATARMITDRVRAATAAYAARLDRQERGLSISDVIGNSSNDHHAVVSNDPKVLRTELAQVRRQVEKIHAARFTPLHPKETVRNIFFGQPYSLELYKNFTDKIELIDEAIELGDGNAILAVALFLKQTLSRFKLHQILTTRPIVVNHLVSYLQKKKCYQECIDLLTASGRYEEASLVAYKHALTFNNIDEKIRKIKNVLQTSFHNHPDNAKHLIEHINLLERLSPVIASDSKNSEITQRQNQTHVPTLSGSSSVMNFAFYANYFHFGKPDNLLSSPAALKKVHKLTEKQSVWVATSARASCFQWKDIEELVLTKGWLGGHKVRGSIDLTQVVKLMASHGASADQLAVFLTLVDPLDEREALAKKFAVHNIVVDVCVLNRDRIALEAYKTKLVPNSREWFYADNALNVSNTKWKN